MDAQADFPAKKVRVSGTLIFKGGRLKMVSSKTDRAGAVIALLAPLLRKALQRDPPLNQAIVRLGSQKNAYPITVVLAANDGAWVEKRFLLGKNATLNGAMEMFRKIRGFVASHPNIEPKRFPASGPRLSVRFFSDDN